MFNFLSESSDEKKLLTKIDKGLKNSFGKVKEELEEHLISINENTNEIQSNYEYLCRLETKIDKLEERINEISMFIKQFKTRKTYKIRKVDGTAQKFQISPLTQREMQVFRILYSIEDEKKHVTYYEIAKNTNISESLAQNYITNLIEKGIPIIKKYLNNTVYLKLDKDFKALQAKMNILNVDENVAEDTEEIPEEF